MWNSRNWGKCGGLELTTNVEELVATGIDSRAVMGGDEGGIEAAANTIVEIRVDFIVVNQVQVQVCL
jgi:hypothetical protein